MLAVDILFWCAYIIHECAFGVIIVLVAPEMKSCVGFAISGVCRTRPRVGALAVVAQTPLVEVLNDTSQNEVAAETCGPALLRTP